MNVYDFDGTIYDGDSTIRFYLYCLKKRPIIIIFCVEQAIGALMYFLKLCSKTKFKEHFFSFIKLIDVDKFVEEFWNVEERNIRQWYKDIKDYSDVIISASPEFLIRVPLERIGVKNIIASNVNKENGKFINENCRGENKVIRFYQMFPNEEIQNFYSDSLSDIPLAKKAEHAFFVKKDKILEWNKKDLF